MSTEGDSGSIPPAIADKLRAAGIKMVPIDPSFDRSKTVKVNADFRDVYNRIQEMIDLGSLVFQVLRVYGEEGFGLIVNEKYGWRTNSDFTLVILVTGNSQSSEVTFTISGAGAGLLSFDWGLHTKMLDKVERELTEQFSG